MWKVSRVNSFVFKCWCGVVRRGYDVVYVASKLGLHTVGMDISEIAIEAANQLSVLKITLKMWLRQGKKLDEDRRPRRNQDKLPGHGFLQIWWICRIWSLLWSHVSYLDALMSLDLTDPQLLRCSPAISPCCLGSSDAWTCKEWRISDNLGACAQRSLCIPIS